MSYNAFLEKTPDATPADKRLFFLSYAQVPPRLFFFITILRPC